MARSGVIWVVAAAHCDHPRCGIAPRPISFFTVKHEAITFMKKRGWSDASLYRVPNEYGEGALWDRRERVEWK